MRLGAADAFFAAEGEGPMPVGRCTYSRLLSLMLMVAALSSLLLAGLGCAPAPLPRVDSPPPPVVPAPAPGEPDLRETPAPDGPWRPHLLSRCRGEDTAGAAVEKSLSAAFELHRYRAGSDAVMELELCLRSNPGSGLLLLTLGQFYLLAGKGDRSLLPREGPAADVGNWSRNRERLLGRAEHLLRSAGTIRPDDGAVDFLLADVAMARGDSLGAAATRARGLGKCALTRSLEILKRYQELEPRPPRLAQNVVPLYPEAAGQARVSGEVIQDLLVSPAGKVVQVVTVSSPDDRLSDAAATALRQAIFEPGKLGDYPLWCWIRVPTRFRLEVRDSQVPG